MERTVDYLDANFCHVRSTEQIVTLLERSPSLEPLAART